MIQGGLGDKVPHRKDLPNLQQEKTQLNTVSKSEIKLK